jgi:hypothetical protein
LVSCSWTVLRYWEHERPEEIVQAILSAVDTAKAGLR